MDILCQAKSGMGKTAVFVLATLQQLEVGAGGAATDAQTSVLVLCHTRELAFQISKEYERFSKYMPGVRIGVYFGGVPLAGQLEQLRAGAPHIVVGTPGRILDLIKQKALVLRSLKHFVLDECDKMLEELGTYISWPFYYLSLRDVPDFRWFTPQISWGMIATLFVLIPFDFLFPNDTDTF